jgi:hypothetical protein
VVATLQAVHATPSRGTSRHVAHGRAARYAMKKPSIRLVSVFAAAAAQAAVAGVVHVVDEVRRWSWWAKHLSTEEST